MRDLHHALVVDDEPATRLSLQTVLSRVFAVRTTAVETGEEAIARLVDTMPDLILLDVHLPGMSGIDALRAIRSLPDGAGENVPVVVISGSQDMVGPYLVAWRRRPLRSARIGPT